MKKKPSWLGEVLVCVFEILVGILLLVNPIGFTSGIIIAAGLALGLMGLSSIIAYFRTEAEIAAQGQMLLKGMILLLAGVFCGFNSHWFVATFPILTLIYGIICLLLGLSKVENATDAIRLKNPRWYIAAINAAISLICAVIILNDPFTTTTLLCTFTGIALIAEAVLDAATAIVLRLKEKVTQPQAPEEETEE